MSPVQEEMLQNCGSIRTKQTFKFFVSIEVEECKFEDLNLFEQAEKR